MEVEGLLVTVGQTISNLKSKHDFLKSQQEQYIVIRNQVLKRGETKIEDGGMVFGDVIIGKDKIFLNIGYEYYVEKSVDEIMEYLDDKLVLMDDAILKFGEKIKEAEKTKVDLEKFKTVEKQTAESGLQEMFFDSNKAEFMDDDGLQAMEIREELDEDGNVISSSVTPTKPSKSEASVDEESSKKTVIDTSDSRPVSEAVNNTVSEIVSDNKIEEVQEIETNMDLESRFNEIDNDKLYSFADLVQQMDEQDDLDDGEFDREDIRYDYDRFNQASYLQSEEEDLEEDEEEDDGFFENSKFSFIPGAAANSSFMDQINKLRMENLPVVDKETTDIPTVTKKSQHPSALKEVSQKSILKTATTNDETIPQTQEKKSKSVGFAKSLDIHEVENLKEETRKNTQRFPNYSNFDYEDVYPENKVLTQEEFDGDLFAKLIGAQGSDEIHEKYQEDIQNEYYKEEEEAEAKKKKRLSRFRKERSLTTGFNELQNNSKVSAVKEVISENHSSISNTAEREVPATSDIVEREVSVTSDIVEREVSVTSDIVEKINAKASKINLFKKGKSKNDHSITSSLFDKNFNSLTKPKHTHDHHIQFSKEMLDYLQNEDDEEDNELETDDKIMDDAGQQFPEDINKAIKNRDAKDFKIPTIDFSALGSDMDSMVKAYSLGIYDNDLEEDPGTLIERIEDFKQYNKEVNELADDIKQFNIANPFPQGQTEEDTPSEDTGAMMEDVLEREIPEDYGNHDDDTDYGLHSDKLNESIIMEYHKLKGVISNTELSSVIPIKEDTSGIELIDEGGNPVKTSRFKSQRSKHK